VADVMHVSSSWMLEEEEGFFRTSPTVARGGGAKDATGAVKSGGGNDLSSDESKFLHKRNPK
jgi:hypothetical protein